MLVRTRSRKSRLMSGKKLALSLTLLYATALLAESKYLTFRSRPPARGMRVFRRCPAIWRSARGRWRSLCRA